MSFIDYLFPKKCINCKKFGDFLCPDCFSKVSYNQTFQCPACLRPSINGLTHPLCLRLHTLDGVVPVVIYNGVVRKMIYQFKYKPHLSKLSETIGEIMVEGLLQNESFYNFIEKYNPVLIPIPLSSKRLLERGYNHAEIIATYVAQYFKLSVQDDILIRVKNTKPQFKLNKEERIKNIAGAFNIRESAGRQIKVPKSVIIIDDITTSFATLKEAAKVLKRNGSKQVLGVTFAKEL